MAKAYRSIFDPAEQWAKAGGWQGVSQRYGEAVKEALEELRRLEVSDSAPSGKPYHQVAEQLRLIRQWTEWAERALVSEASTQDGASVTTLAEPLDRGRGTVIKWAKEPELVGPRGEVGPYAWADWTPGAPASSQLHPEVREDVFNKPEPGAEG